MVGHFDYKHRCLEKKNVPIELILPSRWQDGAESLGMEHTSCLWKNVPIAFILLSIVQDGAEGLGIETTSVSCH